MNATNAMPRTLEQARRCGAKTRAGGSCRQAAMPNGRCRMHGGPNPGAPFGPANGAWRHGRMSRAFREESHAMEQLMKRAKRICMAVAEDC